MATDPDPDALVTPSVAARILGLSVDMVRKLADRDPPTLPALVTTSGRRLFKASDVEELRARRALLPGRRRHAA